jgi:hypothetical protein
MEETMAIDHFETNDIYMAAFVLYLFPGSLLEITFRNGDKRFSTFTFAVPSEDLKIYQEQYRDHTLAIADLKHFGLCHRDIIKYMRFAKESGDEVWWGPAQISGKLPDGQRVD